MSKWITGLFGSNPCRWQSAITQVHDNHDTITIQVTVRQPDNASASPSMPSAPEAAVHKQGGEEEEEEEAEGMGENEAEERAEEEHQKVTTAVLPRDVILLHVQNLKSSKFESRESAAKALEVLAEEEEGSKAIDEIVAAGALKPLVAELMRLAKECSSAKTAADDISQAAEVLTALAKYGSDNVCREIVAAGALEPMVVLVSQGMAAYYDSQNPAVLTLCQLTAFEDIKVQIVSLCKREIKQHVRLLRSEVGQERQDAAGALNRYAAIDEEVMQKIVAAGAVKPLLALMSGGTGNREGCESAALTLGILVHNNFDGVKAKVCEAYSQLSIDSLRMKSFELRVWLGALGELGCTGGLPTGSKKELSEHLKAIAAAAEAQRKAEDEAAIAAAAEAQRKAEEEAAIAAAVEAQRKAEEAAIAASAEAECQGKEKVHLCFCACEQMCVRSQMCTRMCSCV